MVSEKKNAPLVDQLPSVEDFCLAIPLYASFRFAPEKDNAFFSIEHFKGTIDFYCPECQSHSVFRLLREAQYRESTYCKNYIFELPFNCSRDSRHHANFIFRAHNGVLQKIGQTPSLADLANPDLLKYRKVLGEERFRELTRGFGLATHGIGIGAFVYLRRVFEWLIENARIAASEDDAWSEDAYAKARMEERITLLSRYLPEFLVQNRGLYGILSVGVHALTEKQCLEAFPAVKLAIELILDDLHREYERKAKLRAASQSLEALRSSVAKLPET